VPAEAGAAVTASAATAAMVVSARNIVCLPGWAVIRPARPEGRAGRGPCRTRATRWADLRRSSCCSPLPTCGRS
jgi:hypothetical protein